MRARVSLEPDNCRRSGRRLELVCPAGRPVMIHSARNQSEAVERRARESAQARVFMLALVSFAMGIAVSALWFSRKAPGHDEPKKEAVLEQDAAPTHRADTRFAKQTEAPSRPAASNPAPVLAQAIDPAALSAVKRSIPNIDEASVETGARILREAALAELQQAVRDLQARQKLLEQKLSSGGSSGSDEQQKLATKQLKELQLEQMEKIQQIAANAKAQLDAFHQLKEAAH